MQKKFGTTLNQKNFSLTSNFAVKKFIGMKKKLIAKIHQIPFSKKNNIELIHPIINETNYRHHEAALPLLA